jgi:aminopeptidase YwaD
MRPLWIISFGIIFITSTLSAQSERVRRFTEVLCSPEMHGRGYVNGGDSLAAEFIAQQFQEIGLKPFFPNYFQFFQFPVHTFPGKMSLSSSQRNFQPGIHYLVDASSASCSGGYAVRYMTAQEFLKRATIYTTKKEILVVRNVGLTADSARRVVEKLHQFAKKSQVVEVTDSKLMWSVSNEQYANAYIQLQDSVWKVETDSLFIEIEARKKFHTARNVVGWLPSKKKKAPYLFVTAHYDHLGRMGQNTYFPGANDNASGCGMLLELAERFCQKPLKNYNLVFVAFAGEEIGLLGSAAFVRNSPIPLSKIEFLLNLDIMGSGDEGITAVNGSVYTNHFDKLLKINELNNCTPQIKKRGKAANSDHHFFTERGVPSFFVYTNGNNKHYHDIFDTYEELSFASFGGLANLFEGFLREMPLK